MRFGIMILGAFHPHAGTKEPPCEPWTLPEREILLVLEGAARIDIAGGPTLILQVGDMASLPKGAVTTWHLDLPFRELWFFGRPYERE